MTGEGVAYQLTSFPRGSGASFSNIFRFTRIFPVVLSTHRTNISRPSSVAVVNQIRFPQMTGLDHPFSGIGVFQVMFSVSLHRVGSPMSAPSGLGGTCPLFKGPRKSGLWLNAGWMNKASQKRLESRQGIVLLQALMGEFFSSSSRSVQQYRTD